MHSRLARMTPLVFIAATPALQQREENRQRFPQRCLHRPPANPSVALRRPNNLTHHRVTGPNCENWPSVAMSNSSPARHIRRGSLLLGLTASAIAFLFIEGYALQDQLEVGHSSTMFVLGTAFLSAGVCVGLFALIAAIGLGASAFFSGQPRKQSRGPSGSIRPIDHSSDPHAFPLIKPDTIRRPSPVSKRKGYFHRLGS
jgi:hypothetical protein